MMGEDQILHQLVTQLEIVLEKLLQDDNVVIQEATVALREIVKHPLSPTALCVISRSANTVPTRQYAAVLLRKYFSRRKQWNKLQPEVKERVKNMILEGIMTEKERSVYTSLTTLAGALARYELESNHWPDLLQLINSQISSADVEARQAGFLTLTSLSDMAAEQLIPYFNQLLPHLNNALGESSLCAYYAIQTLLHFVPYIGSDHVQGVQSLLPQVFRAVKYILEVDEVKGVEALDLFDELIESEVSVLAPYLSQVVELCVEVTRNDASSDAIKAKALNTIQFIVRQKKRVILKQKLTEPILNLVFMMLCAKQDDDADLDDIDDESPRTCASQTLDSLAINLPPDKIITPTVEWIRGKIMSPSIDDRRGALLAIAIVCEGASDHIRIRHLETFLHWVCPAIQDSNLSIRNEALFALGQMSEHLQPNITKYSNELLPVLFELLSKIHQEVRQGGTVPPSADRVFYALEAFCENLEEELTPHLRPLLETLLSLLLEDVPIKIQMLALSALEATAVACKDELAPYFNEILGYLQRYLQIQNETDTQEESDLQMQALVTLATMARTMKEEFKPIVTEALQLGLALLQSRDDAEVRKCCFTLFAALSTVLKQDMEPFLKHIVPAMITGIKFSELSLRVNGAAVNPASDVFEGLSDSEGSEDLEELESNNEEEDDDDDDIAVYNAALEEKEEACSALKEMATSVGIHFLPYLEESSKEVYNLIGHSYEDIRKVAIEATTAFTVSLYKNCPEKEDVVKQWILYIVPRFVQVIQTDEEPQVVMAGLDGLTELLKETGPLAIGEEGFLEYIVNAVTSVFKGKTPSQLAAEDDGDCDSGDEAPEQEAMLFEYAGEVVPALLKAASVQQLTPTINTLLPLLTKKARKSNSVAERSYSVGCLSELAHDMEDGVIPWVDSFLQLFLYSMRDKNEEVRSNSAYGLGVIAGYAKPEFPTILKALSDLLSKEQDPRTIDNICAAVARMIIADASAVPIDTVMPVLVNNLPLKDDFEENEKIYECLQLLYHHQHPTMLPLLPKVLHATAIAVSSKKIDEDCKTKMREFIQQLNAGYGSEFMQSLQMFSPEIQDLLNSIIS